MKKTYILDTNILLSYPNAIYGFEDNRVGITMTTLRELDSKKSSLGELGYNARKVIHELDFLREKANEKDLTKGVSINNDGEFFVLQDMCDDMPNGLSSDIPDNRIVATVIKYKDVKSDSEVALVTNDVSMRVIASSAHLTNVQGYLNALNKENYYTGFRTVRVKSDFIKRLTDSMEGLPYADDKNPLTENEYIFFINKENEEKSVLAIYRQGKIYECPPGSQRASKVVPKNMLQAAALNALMAPVEDIPLVILCGPAGAAKTFLSLAAGLDKTRNGEYERIYISRNNITGDEAFGYLPGDLEDKMGPLIAPFRDNLVNLIKNQGENQPDQIEMEIDDLFETKMIDLCPMAYIRGRSITNSFVILDEAQNCDRSGIRDLITRAGEGTKIVLLGDTSQIDARNLDKWSNGLIFASNKFKNNPLCAQITFSSEECVRSELAKAAIDILAM